VGNLVSTQFFISAQAVIIVCGERVDMKDLKIFNCHLLTGRYKRLVFFRLDKQIMVAGEYIG